MHNLWNKIFQLVSFLHLLLCVNFFYIFILDYFLFTVLLNIIWTQLNFITFSANYQMLLFKRASVKEKLNFCVLFYNDREYLNKDLKMMIWQSKNCQERIKRNQKCCKHSPVPLTKILRKFTKQYFEINDQVIYELRQIKINWWSDCLSDSVF